MILSIIVAMDQKGVIGANNTLPWRLSSDLKNFKAVTMGKPVIMGRKTWESIGKPLPGRDNVIITRNPDYTADGCVICHSLGDALKRYATVPEVVIIGGHDIFKATIEHADRIYLTQVQADVAGDTWFPVFDWTEWNPIERKVFSADEKNEYSFTYVVLERSPGR